jgi:quercetin 2,3-dioxygenase
MKKIIIKGNYVFDGAGVKIYRLFSQDYVKLTDPFLLLDNFGSEDPKDYINGFPWHPHRGIETVTYMLDGITEHEDSLGNKGAINSGDLQLMSAGGGIYHQEMPKPKKGILQGLQLWVNLPSKNKMMPPKYRDILKNTVQEISKPGLKIKVISGVYENIKGPVKDLIVDVDYFDIKLDKDKAFNYKIKKGYTTFCYLLEGKGIFDSTNLDKGQLILIIDGTNLEIKSQENSRFILVSGKPIKEPIAWGGPIVMNTNEELNQAFHEIETGTFIKKQPSSNPKKVSTDFYN